jgi:hypothetical protein
LISDSLRFNGLYRTELSFFDHRLLGMWDVLQRNPNP